MAGKRFRLNGGAPESLRTIARDVVLCYARKNPSLSALQIRDIFVDACIGVGIAHIVETEPEYHLRDGQKSQARTVEEISIPSGEKLYVSNQWRANNPDDNFYRFMDVVAKKGWGTITI